MSNTSAVSICSNALQRLGAEPISSFEDGTKLSGVCANLWPTTRNALLRGHNWNCATKRVSLSPLAKTPAFDYGYQFQLPGDWLKTLQVGRRDFPIPFTQEGRTILANVKLLPLVYIWENDVPATWDDTLVQAVELAMTAVLAYPVTASTALAESWDKKARIALLSAQSDDGQDVPPEELGGYPLYESRF